MLFKTFTDVGTSQPFTALRGGFDVILTPMTGSNSLTIEREVVLGVWVTFGSAITAAGTTRKSHGIDYTAPVRFRINCGTHDTADILVYLEGDFLADEVTIFDSGPEGILIETGDDMLLENGEYMQMEF